MKSTVVNICKAEECSSTTFCKKLCAKHYSRLQRHGNYAEVSQRDLRPAIVDGDIVKLPLGKQACRGYAVIDSEDKALERYNWSLDGYGYPCAYINGKVMKLHHMTLGKPSANMVTDHINRDKLDARKSNLRFVTYKENSANIPKELFNKRLVTK